MAFDDGTPKADVHGKKRFRCGVATQGNADTGGEIVTGLETVDAFVCSIHCTQTTVSGGTVTITTADPTADQNIHWAAWGS